MFDEARIKLIDCIFLGDGGGDVVVAEEFTTADGVAPDDESLRLHNRTMVILRDRGLGSTYSNEDYVAAALEVQEDDGEKTSQVLLSGDDLGDLGQRLLAETHRLLRAEGRSPETCSYDEYVDAMDRAQESVPGGVR